jgi:hypothetical protein
LESDAGAAGGVALQAPDEEEAAASQVLKALGPAAVPRGDRREDTGDRAHQPFRERTLRRTRASGSTGTYTIAYWVWQLEPEREQES